MQFMHMQVLDVLPDGSAETEQKQLSMAALDPKFWAPRGKDVSGTPPIDATRLRRIIAECACADSNQDPAAMQIRHQLPAPYMGLWPEFPLLRHSCAPNTSLVPIQRHLLMHAAADVPRGAPLTVNRIGSAVFGPARVRQAAVKERVGAAGCGCTRCTLEQRMSDDLQGQLEFMHEWFESEGNPGLAAAMEAEDAKGLERVYTEVAGHIVELERLLDAGEGLLWHKRKTLLGASEQLAV